MPIIEQGGTLTGGLQAVVRLATGQPQDAVSFSLNLKDESNVTVTGFPVFEPAIVHDGIGTYHYPWIVPVSLPTGSYTAVWQGIGAIDGGIIYGTDLVLVVSPGTITTDGIFFLIKPDDYDSIRDLMGVTTLDLRDSDIDESSFAVQAEALIKRRISNWTDQIQSADTLYPLRMAAIYGTAALIAESEMNQTFVPSGAYGHVRSLSVGQGRDWTQAVATFWGRYRFWLDIADESDTDPNDTSLFDYNPLRRSGPTTAHRRNLKAQAVAGVPSWATWPLVRW